MLLRSSNLQSLKKAEGGNTVVTDNLLAYLYDEDTMLGSLSEMNGLSSDALVGAGVAAGVLAGASAIGSLFKNDGGGGGGRGGGSRSRQSDKEIVFQ